MMQFTAKRQGLINDVKVPVQELGDQRGEGAYFQENTVPVLLRQYVDITQIVLIFALNRTS